MATYYGTYGQKVQYLASDPSDPQTGQVWYNSTSATLKVRVVTTTDSWASGGTLNTGRSSMGGAGIQTAALAFAGEEAPGNSVATESYNGTSWTSVSNMNTARRAGGSLGLQTAALYVGGYITGGSVNTETWNGTSWTSVNNASNVRYDTGASGLTSAALALGGSGSSGAIPVGVESWNGTSWTAGTNLPTNRRSAGFSIVGTQTATLYSGGVNTPNSARVSDVYSWNGSSWSTLTNLPGNRGSAGNFGTQTSSLVAGGDDGSVDLNNAVLWNGSSWTTSPATLANAFGSWASASPAPSGSGILYRNSITEEFNGPGLVTTQTITVS